MRVLVTGGAGFIGSHTVDLLLGHGYEVRVVDALLPPVHVDRRAPDYLPLRDIEFIVGDVRDKRVWEDSLQGVDFVIHLAAYQDYLLDFSTFFHTNTVSTAMLYEVILEHHLSVAKVIVASSQAVYGEGRYWCPHCGDPHVMPGPRPGYQLDDGVWDVRCLGCGESMEPRPTDEATVSPHNPYAISKYTQELVAPNLGRRIGIPTVCMRYSIVQGARQSFRNAYSGVLRIFTQRLLHGKPPICYEDGGQIRDYVSVQDVARANLLALKDHRADSQVFNVGGNRRITVWDYACLIAKQSGVDIAPVTPGLYRLGDTRHAFSDISKLEALGWRPVVTVEEIVDEYFGWAVRQPDFKDYTEEADARMASSEVVISVSRGQTERVVHAAG